MTSILATRSNHLGRSEINGFCLLWPEPIHWGLRNTTLLYSYGLRGWGDPGGLFLGGWCSSLALPPGPRSQQSLPSHTPNCRALSADFPEPEHVTF